MARDKANQNHERAVAKEIEDGLFTRRIRPADTKLLCAFGVVTTGPLSYAWLRNAGQILVPLTDTEQRAVKTLHERGMILPTHVKTMVEGKIIHDVSHVMLAPWAISKDGEYVLLDFSKGVSQKIPTNENHALAKNTLMRQLKLGQAWKMGTTTLSDGEKVVRITTSPQRYAEFQATGS